jgi:hypothetical protein
MKFSFKRIASVLTGAVMLSSTVALAAAANYPAPFVKSDGTADVAVVYGSLAKELGTLDVQKAMQISNALGAQQVEDAVDSSTTVEISEDGESFALEKDNSKLNLGELVNSVFTRSVKDSDLPTLLADGTYLDTASDEFEYTQKIDVFGLQLTQFVDSDYKDDVPTLGIKISDDTSVLNYTLTFADDPTWNTMDATGIEIMGKDYYILETNAPTNTTITLLDSSITKDVSEGQTVDITVGGKTYSVTVNDVATDGDTKVSVNGKSPVSALPIGSTWKIEEGVYLAVKDATYKSKESATSYAEISIGAGKLELINGSKIQINDDEIDGVYTYFTSSSGELQDIVISWTPEDELFITDDSTITIPGFETIKLATEGVGLAEEPEITTFENDGKYSISLVAEIASGKVTLPIAGVNASGTYKFIGEDTDKLTATTSGSNFVFNGDDTHSLMVASWVSGEEAETYVLELSFSDSDNVNKTTIKDAVSGDTFGTYENEDTADIGSNLELIIGYINDDATTVNITAGSGVTFDELYTVEGLKVQLPYDAGSAASSGAALNATTGASSITLALTEENEDGDIGAGESFNVVLGTNSDGYTQVSTSGTNASDEIGNTDVYQEAVYGSLGTIINVDQGPDQDTVEVRYNGMETYATLYLVAPSAVTTSTGGETGKVIAVMDSEMDKFENKNLIVVGGSCVNTVAATLLGSSSPLCGADFTAASGVGPNQYLIQTFESPYANGKFATLVAGYEAAQTQQAVDYLLDDSNEVSTTVGEGVMTGEKLMVDTA